MKLGLKIDIDTYRGTKMGVIPLCKLLDKYGISATFYFSVGPDNMGRNLWRLFNPAFLAKMLRSNAPGLYGLDIIFKGTFWPGPIIGKNFKAIFQSIKASGHEIGLHAWDHYAWQTKVGSVDELYIEKQLKLGLNMLQNICGIEVNTSAAPAWKADSNVLTAKSKFNFLYNSDCRGDKIFKPKINNVIFDQIQIPTTLPTFDEVIGQNNINVHNYNDYIISLLKPNSLNILTIHAEAEGIIMLNVFEKFIHKAKTHGYGITNLKNLLNDELNIPICELVKKEIPGRAGWIAVMEEHK